jgi:N12 class adenine-specific DNA methylase
MEGTDTTPPFIAAGEKGKARDIIAAIRTLQTVEREHRPATTDERSILGRFGGFGAVALGIFPDPITGGYKDAGWQAIGEELKSLLSPAEYDSAKRTTFSQFFTSPVVMQAMHRALRHLGVPENATLLEPGCGVGNFMSHAPAGHRFIGVELDGISGRIARALHPEADIRIENYADTRLPEGSVDAVIGNVPFADVKIDYRGRKLSLHDFFLSKSLDKLKPGGILAVVTSHFTLDKLNAAAREDLAERADFLGAIRLPSDAFKREGTAVTTDILFLRKRSPGQAAAHADPEWLQTSVIGIPLRKGSGEPVSGADLPVNRYFCNHHQMVLGDWSRKDTLYGTGGFSVVGHGDLAEQLDAAIRRLPEHAPTPAAAARAEPAPAFTPPPPERHIAEGSFFIADDKVIHQVEGGQGVPVVYGGVTLKSDGTMTGKRLAALIGLRDAARRVLQSQNEGWPDAHRNDARRKLNFTYDRFAAAYGPINKTTFSETADGSVIRRMPNLVKFREDPDAMLVMALEDYDEVTGKAAKAPILLRDVVGKSPPITTVASAEEGLLVSLDRTGGIDLAYIARLYGKPEEAIVAELGDLIYRDPESKAWQTADEYLSGNVRGKLAAAVAAGPAYARNAEALKGVQPEDVLPGDIDASLGAPWIPPSDIQAFAAHLFGVSPTAITIGHLKKDAVWSVEAGHAAEASVAATAEYGTARVGGVTLLEQALNLKTPVVYDPDPIDSDKRVVNQEQTLAAREKQAAIKATFKSWIFADAERADRLVRLYNDTYNNLRPLLFDGSHLQFPGMSTAITLRPHQKDAVWRGISSGNMLLAHTVGAGKTWIEAAAAMKKKQMGLARKPVIAVPNHMLEQFGREFMQLYPNAKLLVATKDDLAKDRRKLLTAKIATGEWDAIIITHSSFERIGMSSDYQERFLHEQIREYEELLRDAAVGKSPRNIIKTLEKQKTRREEKLKDLAAADKKDDGLVFDLLGIDDMTVDEAHYFKNLETPTKMERVAGIQTGGSERAFDLYMKCRYLDEMHPGHGITFATGTPISNTMGEKYTMQRFLDLKGLKDRGIEHFDGWAATFGEIVEAMEISPDGASLRPRSRFARFVNLPELQTMFRTFADVQTAEMLNLPRPKLEGGKPHVVACPMSEEQARLQQELVARYDKLRTEKVDPRVDNALAITTDGRKLALDARLLSAAAEDFPGSKVNALAGNVGRIWAKTAATRGTQMIFCDMGVNPTQWGYCVYDEIIGKLTAAGVPREQIAAVGDADSDAKKQALFDRVRSGSVRVLIGSTAKMGTGTNVQKRLAALHHLDAPWKPAEVEQRDGRILRQGNENKEVAIYRYVTEGSFDAYMWQALETKARFISQVMTGDNATRRAEDIGGQELSYAEVKAIASGNPAVLTLAAADAELQRLDILRKNHDDEQFLARRSIRELPQTIARLEQRIEDLSADLATADAHKHDPLTIAGRTYHSDDALAALGRRLDSLPETVRQTTTLALGQFRGLAFGLVLHAGGAAEVFVEGQATRHALLSREHRGPRAVLNALERIADGYRGQIDTASQDLAIAQGQLRDHQARLGKPFPHNEYLSDLTNLRDQLRAGLSQSAPEPGTEPVPVSEIAERIKALKAAHTIDATPERTARRRLAAEEPVTARIRRRSEAMPIVEPPAEPAASPFAKAPADTSPATAPVVEAPAPVQPEELPPATIHPFPNAEPATPAQPQTGYRRHINHARRKEARQLSLF